MINITWDNDKNKTNISDSAFLDLLSDPTINSDLTDDDKDFIITSFGAKMYNYVVEYVYNKSIKKIQDNIFKIGDDIVVNIIHWIDRTFISNFFDIFVLRLACDIDLISREEKLIILKVIEYLQGKKDSFSDTEDINKEKTKYFIVKLYLSVLSRDFDEIINKIKDIIEILETKNITCDMAEYQDMLKVTNKHKNILLRLLFALVKTGAAKESGKRFKTLCQNMKNLIVDLWERTSLNDKKFYSYYLKSLSPDQLVFKTLSNMFEPIKLIDFTTDLSVITTILKSCQDVLSCHYSINNQKDETAGLVKIREVEVYPRYFLRSVITPCLVTYLGNNNGYLSASRAVAEEIFSEISSEKWAYYFKNFFKGDDFVLINLINVRDCLKDFCSVIKKAQIDLDSISDSQVKELLISCKEQDFDNIQRISSQIFLEN